MTTLSSAAQALLEQIGAGGQYFQNPRLPLVKSLERDGFITADPSKVNPENKQQIAYTVTNSGRDLLPDFDAEGGTDTEGGTDIDAEGDRTSAPKVIKRRGPHAQREVIIQRSGARMAMPANISPISKATGRREKYGFSKLEAPNADGFDSFFVNTTSTLPNPAVSLGSHVSKANKKWRSEGRFFRVVAVAVDAEFGVPGARVMRVDGIKDDASDCDTE